MIFTVDLNKDINVIIGEVLPELFDIVVNKDVVLDARRPSYLYYFKDKTISKDGFRVLSSEITTEDVNGRSQEIVCVEMVKTITPNDRYDRIDVDLIFNNPQYGTPRDDHGVIRMNKDAKLSDQSCVALFKMGINILYYCPDAMDYVGYNRTLIMRRHTIKNILE